METKEYRLAILNMQIACAKKAVKDLSDEACYIHEHFAEAMEEITMQQKAADKRVGELKAEKEAVLSRIKPEPTYIPFTFEDRDGLRGKWVKRKDSGSEGIIYHMSKTHINKYTWKQALEILEFLDGSPFGKLKKNEE